MSIRWLKWFCSTLLLIAYACAQAAPAPRAAVGGIAKAIEDNFHDPARGKQIADELRADAKRGTFDRLTDARDLATALTDRLRPVDRHFSVEWSAAGRDRRGPGGRARVDVPTPGAPAVARAGSPPPPGPVVDGQRRANYGVRRVEVLPGNVGYIDLRQFADFEFGAADQPGRQAIEAALQLVVAADALIIDLRANGGGSPAMVGYLSSAFTAPGSDIFNTFHFRENTESEAPRDWYPSPRLTTPLYILISARTGSAAEAFAYTLKNARRATIVGETSAGAANPGGPVDAGNGFTIFVSNGSPVSPITKTNWEGTGVLPDVAVDAAAALDQAKLLAYERILADGLAGTDAEETRWVLEATRAESAQRQRIETGQYAGQYGSLVIKAMDGALSMQRGRRPALALLPIATDTFSGLPDHAVRVRFERDGEGAIVALEMLTADGGSSRYRRGE